MSSITKPHYSYSLTKLGRSYLSQDKSFKIQSLTEVCLNNITVYNLTSNYSNPTCNSAWFEISSCA